MSVGCAALDPTKVNGVQNRFDTAAAVAALDTNREIVDEGIDRTSE